MSIFVTIYAVSGGGLGAVLAWPTTELSRSCKIFLQAAVILTRKGGGGAGPERAIRISLNMDRDQVESHWRFCGQNKCNPKSVASKKIEALLSKWVRNEFNQKQSTTYRSGNMKGCKQMARDAGSPVWGGELREAVYCISLAKCSVQSGLVLGLVAEQEGKWLVQDKECTSSGQTSLLLSPVTLLSTSCPHCPLIRDCGGRDTATH